MDQEEWSPYTNNKVAAYANIPPGNHTFHVRAMDPSRNVDYTPASWNFTVLLPWYKEPFYWLSTVLSSLLVLLFAGYAIHRQLNLGRLVAERTATLSIANEEMLEHRKRLQNLTAELSLTEERERRRLATDLHDSVSQS